MGYRDRVLPPWRERLPLRVLGVRPGRRLGCVVYQRGPRVVRGVALPPFQRLLDELQPGAVVDGHGEHPLDGGEPVNLGSGREISIRGLTEQFGGHELVVKRMTWQQLDTVASFLAAATKSNPYLARVSDG